MQFPPPRNFPPCPRIYPSPHWEYPSPFPRNPPPISFKCLQIITNSCIWGAACAGMLLPPGIALIPPSLQISPSPPWESPLQTSTYKCLPLNKSGCYEWGHAKCQSIADKGQLSHFLSCSVGWTMVGTVTTNSQSDHSQALGIKYWSKQGTAVRRRAFIWFQKVLSTLCAECRSLFFMSISDHGDHRDFVLDCPAVDFGAW